jgi:hypothetical protein
MSTAHPSQQIFSFVGDPAAFYSDAVTLELVRRLQPCCHSEVTVDVQTLSFARGR